MGLFCFLKNLLAVLGVGGWLSLCGNFCLGLAVALAFAEDGRLQPSTQFVGKLVYLGAAIDLNRALGGVTDHVTVMTPLQMFLEVRLGLGVHGVVEVIA